MTKCAACDAKFGPKFDQLACSKCQGSFCAAHLIPSQYISVHSLLTSQFGPGHGLCLDCILAIWGKEDADLKEPKGILGRAKENIKVAGEVLASAWRPGRSGLMKFSEKGFEALNEARAFAVFRHQKDIDQEFLIKDLTKFARVYAVANGRNSERNFNLKDIYHLVDWLRTHPRLPKWAQTVTWDLIESSPNCLSHLSDVWHVAQAAIAVATPGAALVGAGYHVADRAVDQYAGKGLAAFVYEKVKDSLGLNVNLKAALIYYFAGLFIIQLLAPRVKAVQAEAFA